MKVLLQFILVLIATVCVSCSNSDDVPGKPEARIEQFTLQCGDTYYRGTVNEETKVIRVGGIISRQAITGVKCQLSGGASISPNPSEVKRWEKEQKFIVTSSDKQTAVYTLLLPQLQDEPEAPAKAVIGYLPAHDWEFEDQFDKIHWEYLTHVNVSFAHAKSDGTLNTDKVPADKLRRIVTKAHGHGVKVLISINKSSAGEFAAAIDNEASRNALVANIVAFTRDNQLDGFDIDYEDYNNWKKASLVAFAKALHEAKEEGMLMTCAVICWKDYTAEWQEYFDYINIMSYDRVMGGSNTKPGQHASYDDFVNDMNHWVSTYGAPKSKIVGGLPFYGYSWDAEVNKDDVGAVRFHGILDHFSNTYDAAEVADADQISKTYYNGRPTIRRKCQYVMDNDFGGVMIWQLFQDAYQEDFKLIKAVGEVMVP